VLPPPRTTNCFERWIVGPPGRGVNESGNAGALRGGPGGGSLLAGVQGAEPLARGCRGAEPPAGGCRGAEPPCICEG